jgi:hypothetical protein
LDESELGAKLRKKALPWVRPCSPQVGLRLNKRWGFGVAEAQINSVLATKHQNDEHDDNNQAEGTAADPYQSGQNRGDEMKHSDVLF